MRRYGVYNEVVATAVRGEERGVDVLLQSAGAEEVSIVCGAELARGAAGG